MFIDFRGQYPDDRLELAAELYFNFSECHHLQFVIVAIMARSLADLPQFLERLGKISQTSFA